MNNDWGFYVDIETHQMLSDDTIFLGTQHHLKKLSEKKMTTEQIDDLISLSLRKTPHQEQRKIFEMFATIVGCFYLLVMIIC